MLNKYSSNFSKHDFTQHAFFTLLAMKNYTRSTYRQIINLLEFSDKIERYLHLKKFYKFFQRLPTAVLQDLNKQMLINHQINGKIFALYGSRFTNDYTANIMQ